MTKYAFNFRFLAFLAISCSIGAVAGVSSDPLLFTVGVAGLATGTIYMWRVRYAGSRVRTGVLLLLLLILLAFLGRDMLFSLNSDPLLLARYLVFGLIVSSFDLRTRRHVLGTLVLAGMLFVLLTTMAFSPWFPVLIGTFVLLTLAAATMGHIDEEASRAIVVGGGSLRAAGTVWTAFATVFVLLSVAIFLLMPRIGASGLVQASWLPSRIDLTRGGPILLPSLPGAGLSPGVLPSQQLRGAGDYVTLGYTGPAADTVVMHVRSRVLSYWRGATLDQYDGAGWLPSTSRVTLVDEGQGSYVFPDSELRAPGRRWYSQTYYLRTNQPNAIFTGYSPGRVFLPRSSQTGLYRGTVYRAVSPVPALTPGRLRRDQADATQLADLALPPIGARTKALAESIVEGAATDWDKALRLEQFLLRNYPYDLGVEPLAPGRDAVEVFLFEQQAGYCSQFATAMAVMARHVGLPARVAIGYLPGVYDPLTGATAVRAGDAHAWVEIRFRNAGWVAFDPTPRPDVVLGPGTGQGWVTFGLMDFIGVDFTGAVSSLAGDWVVGRLSVPRWGGLAILGAVALAGALATLLLAGRKRRSGPHGAGYTALAGEPRRAVLSVYERMGVLLVRRGLPPRRPAQTPSEYLREVAPRFMSGLETVAWLTEATGAAAYDPRPFGSSMAREAGVRFAALPRTLAVRTN
ncbi:MAG: transglutaminaseTgpA domain-containing protein [Chloroflexi bacterium]|nr:transglutaminaseTgpA domain-containing protein [Chloroflexota bacterium]